MPADDTAPVRLELKFPAVEPVPRWLTEVLEFRARIAWNDGQRPAFRLPDGTFSDPDPHDLPAYHLILRALADDRLVGCVRYAPLEAITDSRIRQLDPVAAEKLLAGHGRSDDEVLEGARLFVDPGWQGRGLAGDLLLAGTALARLLGRRLIWGTAGVRQRQERVFLRLGYWAADVPPIVAPHYDDELRVVLCDPAEVPEQLEPRIAGFAAALRPYLTPPAS